MPSSESVLPAAAPSLPDHSKGTSKTQHLLSEEYPLKRPEERKASGGPAGRLLLLDISVTSDVKNLLPFFRAISFWVFLSNTTVNNEGDSFHVVFLLLHSAANISSAAFFLSPADNSISVLAKHDAFRRQKQEMYFLPIIVTDNGNPPMSSTNTLTIRVCGCSKDGIVQSCNVEAYVLPIGLSMGALIAILACIILLLGEQPPARLARVE